MSDSTSKLISISEAMMAATTTLRVAMLLGGDLQQLLKDVSRDEALPPDAREQARKAVAAAEAAWDAAKADDG